MQGALYLHEDSEVTFAGEGTTVSGNYALFKGGGCGLGTEGTIGGLSNYSAAVFHLGNHVFFKPLLFLGAGSVVHAVGDEQDIYV